MHSVRRAALRSALAVARATTPKAPASSFVSRLESSQSRNTKLFATPLSRYFSQTARVAEEPKSEELGPEASEAAEVANALEAANPRDSRNASGQSEGETPHGLFIRNLVFDIQEAQLTEALEQYGTVTKTVVARDARGLSKGFAFAWFETAEAAKTAFDNLDGSFWHGRRLQVKAKNLPKSQSRVPLDPTTQLYIGNIPYETTDAELNRIFKSLDNITDVRIAIDRVTGWPRGFAHADFADVPSAEAAFKKLNGMQIGGRELRCDFALDSGKTSKKEEPTSS